MVFGARHLNHHGIPELAEMWLLINAAQEEGNIAAASTFSWLMGIAAERLFLVHNKSKT
jgi:hypothetical protein